MVSPFKPTPASQFLTFRVTAAAPILGIILLYRLQSLKQFSRLLWPNRLFTLQVSWPIPIVARLLVQWLHGDGAQHAAPRLAETLPMLIQQRWRQRASTTTCPSSVAKEHVIGWYSTGPKLRENDLGIHELFRNYCPNLVLVIIDVQPRELGIPTKAYYAVEEVKEDATQKSQKAFVHVASEIGAYKAEEIGVEHLLREEGVEGSFVHYSK